MKPIARLALPLALFTTCAGADESNVQLKDGPGKDRLLANCVLCHSADYIQMNSPFLDRKGWEAEVTKMVKVFGAPIREEDVPEIVEYLTKYYGK